MKCWERGSRNPATKCLTDAIIRRQHWKLQPESVTRQVLRRPSTWIGAARQSQLSRSSCEVVRNMR